MTGMNLPKLVHDPVLLCPKCYYGTLLVGPPNGVTTHLICENCNYASYCGADNFFDFREVKVSQEQSLLTHQDLNFYTNSTFKKFALNRVYSHIKEIISEFRPVILLDIGAGNGEFAKSLGTIIERYYGLDPSDIPMSIYANFGEIPISLTLIHNTPEYNLPIQDESIDMVSLIAAYDHIPDIERLVEDSWRKIKPGGRLFVVMTNYNYWLKALINLLLRTQKFKHQDEHYRVHSVNSLIQEVQSIIPEAKVSSIDADDRYIPNFSKSRK